MDLNGCGIGVADGTENVPEANDYPGKKNIYFDSFLNVAFNNNNLLGFNMKMQHTVYLTLEQVQILERLDVGKGKQGNYNYNKAIITCIEQIEKDIELINAYQAMTEAFDIQVGLRRKCGCLK